MEQSEKGIRVHVMHKGHPHCVAYTNGPLADLRAAGPGIDYRVVDEDRLCIYVLATKKTRKRTKRTKRTD